MDLNRKRYESLSIERMRIISAIREANEITDSKYKIDVLSRSFEHTVQPIEKLSSEFVELGKRHEEALAIFRASLIEKVSGLSDLQAEVSALLREEFDLGTDIEEMKNQLQEEANKTVRAVEKHFATLKRIWRDQSMPDNPT